MVTQNPDPLHTAAASDGLGNETPEASLFAVPKKHPEAEWDAYFQSVQKAMEPEERRETGYELELPSGLTVWAQRVSLMLLLRHGHIPDALTPLVNRFLTSHQVGVGEYLRATADDIAADPDAKVLQFAELLQVVWVNAVLRPRFALNPSGPDEHPVSLVQLDDLLYVFEWCQGVTLSLASFRKRQALLVEATRESKDVRDATKRLFGDFTDPTKLVGVADQ
jgi:hypothetical protein